MIRIQRTDAKNHDFIKLVQELDAYLAVTDGEEHSFYDQFNKIDQLKYVVIAYESHEPLGCGALKQYQSSAMEVKRMYVSPESRGKGIGTQLLAALEDWAAELSYEKCILETGKRQHEAVKLYKKNGYQLISNYGQYADVENSLCFEKQLTH